MNLNLQRKIDRIIGSFICWILSLYYRIRKKGPLQFKPKKKILVILLSEMGSIFLAHPMFDCIKKKYPESTIFVLMFERNKEALELLDIVSPENIITVCNNSLIKLLSDSISALFKLRRFKIDVVIDCELFSRISSIFSFLSGAGIRAGFSPYTQEGLYRGNFINRPVLYNPYNHISEQFITLVEALESDHVPTVKRKIFANNFKIPPLKVTKNEIDHALKKLETDFSQIAGKPIVLLYPGGGLLPIRAWPIEYFSRIAEDFIVDGYAVCVIGVEEDRMYAEQILSHHRNDNCIDLTGYTKNIRELMIIFHFAALLISNDGGPGHFAAMTPIPSIVFYGPETPKLYASLSPNSFDFYVPLACSPCLTAYNHRNSPCNGNNLCLKYIRPEDVLIKAYEILKKRVRQFDKNNSPLALP